MQRAAAAGPALAGCARPRPLIARLGSLHAWHAPAGRRAGPGRGPGARPGRRRPPWRRWECSARENAAENNEGYSQLPAHGEWRRRREASRRRISRSLPPEGRMQDASTSAATRQEEGQGTARIFSTKEPRPARRGAGRSTLPPPDGLCCWVSAAASHSCLHAAGLLAASLVRANSSMQSWASSSTFTSPRPPRRCRRRLPAAHPPRPLRAGAAAGPGPLI